MPRFNQKRKPVYSVEEIKDTVILGFEERLERVRAAAFELVEQVEAYTMHAGLRSQLLNAKERLKKVLRE